MNSIIIYTENKPIPEDCAKSLKKYFKHVHTNTNQVCCINTPESFYIDFWEERINDSIEPLTKKEQKIIKMNNPYSLDIDFHFVSIIRKVVQAIFDIYPDAVVYDDQENWYGPAKEYITKPISYEISTEDYKAQINELKTHIKVARKIRALHNSIYKYIKK